MYTSCTQNFHALQFNPVLLELATVPLPIMSLSIQLTFPYLVEFSKFGGWTPFQVQKSLKEFVAPLHPRYLLPFPIDINYAFKSHNWRDMFKNIGFNKWKSWGHLPLKWIDMWILWDLVICFSCILNLIKKKNWLELATMPLPTMTLSIRPTFTYLVEFQSLAGWHLSGFRKV